MKNRFCLNKRSNLFATCKDITITSLTKEAFLNRKTVETMIREKKGIVVTEAVTIEAETTRRIIVQNERDLLPEITISKVNLIGNQRSIMNQTNEAAR